MKILISPAKTLDFETPLPTQIATKPLFLPKTRIVNKALKPLKPSQLRDLMDISQDLADLNHKRNRVRTFSSAAVSDIARQAIYAFAGDVYTGIDAYSIPLEKLERLQADVRILSGLYGMLRPLDLIQAYRLEMGTDLPVGDAKNLYRFWKELLTKALNKELRKGDWVLNLASVEYFSAIDKKALKAPIVSAEFKDFKDGKLMMISFFAKKARGMMVRYIIDTDAKTVDDLKGFNYDGYGFDAHLSKPDKLVFTR